MYLDKVTARYGTEEHDPHNTRFLDIVEIFPRDSYPFIGGGEDSEGKISLAGVLDEGGDKAELESRPMAEFDMRGAGEILIAGNYRRNVAMLDDDSNGVGREVPGTRGYLCVNPSPTNFFSDIDPFRIFSDKPRTC